MVGAHLRSFYGHFCFWTNIIIKVQNDIPPTIILNQGSWWNSERENKRDFGHRWHRWRWRNIKGGICQQSNGLWIHLQHAANDWQWCVMRGNIIQDCWTRIFADASNLDSLREDPCTKYLTFLTLSNGGVGVQTHVQKSMLQILYNSSGFLAI